MKSFQLAAQQQVEEEESGEEKILEFTIAGKTFQSKLATTGQISLFFAGLTMGSVNAMGGVYKFLRGVMPSEDYQELIQMVERGDLPLEILFDLDATDETIVGWIISESGTRPTQSSTDSSPSQAAGGKRSTGRSPGKGSTRSS